ncbi:MAG: aminotransferase class III-fold pyridoxal phosphate-dependent enzyme [candidate division KSB1 bacterium]|nr:aminotransferase class III-fold pyridoxal phosphate-dependent enzyme [candidate division KSB1 bacterium]MDZ7304565.1 aminotransferase class III-fold pyridoxal phosphate-dependent enzyme [candidate division KSB1 bacterium]MDZ7313640.1 aminotransferase class III-fold pyridoxal phosphate-dependent enzyme [candidate division KSB1 bacterium]
MQLFEVYPLYDIEPVKAQDVFLWDKNGTPYLDFYGGHAVISIGHGHPHYVRMLTEQLHRIGFYSNAVQIPLQKELANKLGELSGYDDYHLFLCNSGAEANENALKLASFHNGRKAIVAFQGSFHGRTSAAIAVTDNPKIRAPLNQNHEVVFLPMNDEAALQQAFQRDDICAAIIEGIQGVAGIRVPEPQFLQKLQALCQQTGALLILDEVQSGLGRTGKFFAHQHAGIQPDLITIAKGMGNGFPVAGVLIHPKFKASHGLLGTTFGGNHLACAAALAVLEIIEREKLVENSTKVGNYLQDELRKITKGIREVRGRGLMIGVELEFPSEVIRKKMLYEHKIFTGSSRDPNTIRLLPPLTLQQPHADRFLECLAAVMKNS